MPLPAVLSRHEDQLFVGRAAQLRRLRECRQRSRGQGGLVLLAGEPGIGKTRLAARVAAEAYADGCVVLYGRADEESVTPYEPFVEALRHYAAHRPGLVEETRLANASARELARLIPELGQSIAPAVRGGEERERSRHELFDAFVRLLLHAAAPPGLLLVLEDLHWADVPTLLLLRDLVRRDSGSPLLVIATSTDLQGHVPGPSARMLADLRREAGSESIQLRGLRPSEAAALVAAHTGRSPVDGALVEQLLDQTGGNPFFIEELLHTPAPATPAVVPEGVKDVIGRRLDRLPHATLEALTLAAVLGNDFRLATLQAVMADRSQDALIAALEEAVADRLILEDPEEVDRFSFTHALVRQTLYERPIASRRLRLHRRVAVALEASMLPVHPAELAHHYFQAREVGGASKAIVFSLKAGEARQSAHAYEDAAAHYERALSCLEIVRRDDAAARCDVLLALGAVRWQASEPDPRSPFLQAVELARRLPSSDRLARAALGAGGRFYAPAPRTRRTSSCSRRRSRRSSPGTACCACGSSRAWPRSWSSRSRWSGPASWPTRRSRWRAASARRARSAAALMGRHAALLHVEHAQERRRVGEQALALAGELEPLELAALARHWLLYDLAELGDLAEAQRRQSELDLAAEELRQPLYRHSSLAWHSVWTALAGRFEEAEQVARESLRLAEHAGAPARGTHFTAQLVAVRREQGRLHELLPEIEQLAGDEPAAAAWRCLLPLAHLDAGDRVRAQAAYDRAVPATPETMLWLTAMGSLAEAAAQLGDVAGGARLHAELEPYADRLVQWSFTGNAGSVHRLLGRTAAVAGRRDQARRPLRGGAGAPRRARRRGAAGADALRLRGAPAGGQARRARTGAHAPARGERRRPPAGDGGDRRPRRLTLRAGCCRACASGPARASWPASRAP